MKFKLIFFFILLIFFNYQLVFCNGNESLEFFNEGIQEEIPELKIEAYNRAIEINPYFTRAYFNRGIIYYNLNNYEKAIDDLTKVLKFG